MSNINEKNILCNGTSSGSTSSTVQNVQQSRGDYDANNFSVNLNWLLYTLYAREEYAQCRNLIEKQLRENYDREFTYYVKGLVERHDGRFIESIKCFQYSIGFNSKNSNYFKEIGKTLYMMGKFKQSLDVFMEAEQLLQYPDAEIYHYIGELLYRNFGRPKAGLTEAKGYYHQAVQNGRQNVDSFRKLAEIFVKENDYPKAIEMLEGSLTVTQETAEILTEIGILHLKLNDPQGAYDKLIRAVQIDENSPKALLGLGAVLQSRNDVDGALNRYKKIKNVDNDGPELWSNLGLCFFKKQKYIAAIACLKKSIWLSPLNFNVLYNLGLVYVAAQQYTSAFHAFATAINLRTNHAECYMLLGICLKNLNDKNNAFLAFERSTLSADAIKNPLLYLNFALFCYEIGREDLSQSNLQHFYEMRDSLHVNRDHVKQADKLKLLLNYIDEGVDIPPKNN